ncbi:MAG TPA: ABC transporter ATP-binding protein [Candidatus Choladocola avistercoris]|nr:ABC transporter ATP-binding protein [Candidatus Choladocola avistercoris]
MLDIQNISVTFEKNPEPAVAGVNLEMKRGEIVCIVGESGSGKTTVIRAVLGCLPGGGYVSEGNIRFEGKSLLGFSREDWRKLRGKDISMIFQDSGAMINPVRRIGAQYVEYIRTHEKMSKKDAWDRGIEMLERMQLPSGDNIMRSYPFQLSGGMRQRVGIAMAMTFRPKLLLADEPTSALDVTIQAQIVRQMMELRENYHTGMIVVTHNLGVAAYMADKIVVMKQGRVVETGYRDQILYHPSNEYTENLLEAVPTIGGTRFV